jgi:hypothetical protein
VVITKKGWYGLLQLNHRGDRRLWGRPEFRSRFQSWHSILSLELTTTFCNLINHP